MAALSYLSAVLVQGGADAFIQAQIATALSGADGIAFRLREILLTASPAQAASASFEFSLTRKSFAAMPTLVEKSLITRFSRAASFTTSGLFIVDTTLRIPYSEDDAPIIVEDPLYAQIDTATTGAAGTFYVRLGYTQEKISAVDRLTLIANSLS
jgi:hypothetical protein